MNSNCGFATLQIHAGKQKNAAGALCAPIYQTSTFEFDSVEQGGNRFAGKEAGYIYTRIGNPSLTHVQDKIAALEKGEACVATASGMGAITAAVWTLIEAGDEIVASDTLYGCTFSLFNHGLTRLGIKTHFVDFTDLDAVKKAINDKTKIVYLETPCNPNLKIVDIKAVADLAHSVNKKVNVIVDNTFASPYLTQPLTLGADIVVHSATKYLNGHGDVIAGFVVGKKDFINNVLTFGIKDMTGCVLSPFDAFLIARGLKTLDIRMERHCDNAEKIAAFLESHPAVEKVYYPGLKSFEGHDVAAKQMKRFGGMLSFTLKVDKNTTAAALNKLKLCTIAVSLGDAETLVEHAASMTHSTYTAEELKASGIPESLIRVSCGLENAEDIIADFKEILDPLAK